MTIYGNNNGEIDFDTFVRAISDYVRFEMKDKCKE